MSFSPTAQTPQQARENPQAHRHVQIQTRIKPEQVQEVVDAFLGLRDKVNANVGAPGIVLDIQHGLKHQHRGQIRRTYHIFVVTFQNEAAWPLT